MSTEIEENLCLAEAWLSTELMYDQHHVALHLLPSFTACDQTYSSYFGFQDLAGTKPFRDDLENLFSCSKSGSTMKISPASHSTSTNTTPAAAAAAAASDDDLMSRVNNDVMQSPPMSSSLLDCSMRALCKKVTLNEAMMHQAIERLGGGDKGLTLLMDYVRFWADERSSNSNSTSSGDQQFSISGSLEQLCVTPSATAAAAATSSTGTQTLIDYSCSSPHTKNGRRSSSRSTTLVGDHLETPPLASLLCHRGAQLPGPLQQAADLNWQQQKRKRSVDSACTAMGLRCKDDPGSVETGAAGAQYFRVGNHQQTTVWHTQPSVLVQHRYGKPRAAAGNSYYSTPTAAATRAARKHRMACQRQQLSKSYGVAANTASAHMSNSSSSYAMQQQRPASPQVAASLTQSAAKTEPILLSPGATNMSSWNTFSSTDQRT
ncbi:unnamed protein product [Sphagnum tenellum]